MWEMDIQELHGDGKGKLGRYGFGNGLHPRYILDLAAAFNHFYHECKIANCEDEALRNSRLALTAAAKRVLGTALHLICLDSPEKI